MSAKFQKLWRILTNVAIVSGNARIAVACVVADECVAFAHHAWIPAIYAIVDLRAASDTGVSEGAFTVVVAELVVASCIVFARVRFALVDVNAAVCPVRPV